MALSRAVLDRAKHSGRMGEPLFCQECSDLKIGVDAGFYLSKKLQDVFAPEDYRTVALFGTRKRTLELLHGGVSMKCCCALEYQLTCFPRVRRVCLERLQQLSAKVGVLQCFGGLSRSCSRIGHEVVIAVALGIL